MPSADLDFPPQARGRKATRLTKDIRYVLLLMWRQLTAHWKIYGTSNECVLTFVPGKNADLFGQTNKCQFRTDHSDAVLGPHRCSAETPSLR
jgi:hypothetical protein